MKLSLSSKTFGIIAGLLLALLPRPNWAAEAADEEQIKLAYLSKFPKFVYWPKQGPLAEGAEFNFCVVGDDELSSITAALAGERIGGHVMRVQDGKRSGSLAGCQVVYLSRSETWRARGVLTEIRSLPILSISSLEGFAAEGGMIGLVKQDGHLKFEVNLKAAQQAGLQISSQLAQLAIKVHQ